MPTPTVNMHDGRGGPPILVTAADADGLLRLQRGSKLKHHFLVSYRLSLLAVCRLQFSVRGTAAGRAGVLAMGDDAALHGDMQRDGYALPAICTCDRFID